jgi:hypothetical protein
MASGNDKDLKIGITADTSGAEKATSALGDTADATKQVTAATRELTEAEKDFQTRKEAFDARMAAKRAAGTNTAAPEAEGPNPMTDGSQLRSGGASKHIEETTTALKEQVEVLEEVAEAEDSVARSTGNLTSAQGKLNEEAKKPDGFKSLFDQQRMIQVGRLMGDLARAVGDFAREFSKTEQGQEMMSKLSKETEVYGKTLGSVVAGAAEGFAVGGPIGGLIGGLTGAVKNFAEEYIDAQARIEASNKGLAVAEAEHAALREKKMKAGATREVENQLRRETDELEDQNEALRENEALMRSRQDLAKAEFELKQAQDEASGKSKEEMDTERIQFELQQKNEMLSKQAWDRKVESNVADSGAVQAEEAARKIGEVNGTLSPEFQAAQEKAKKAREAAEDDKRRLPKDLEQIENERRSAGLGAAAGLTRISTRSADRLEREAQREKEKKDREKEQQEREEERERDADARKREGVGRGLEGIADRGASIVGKGNPKAAQSFEKIGDALANDPTAKEIGGLSKLLEGLEQYLGPDSERAREVRKLQDQMRRLEGQLKKGGDVSHK